MDFEFERNYLIDSFEVTFNTISSLSRWMSHVKDARFSRDLCAGVARSRVTLLKGANGSKKF